MSFWGKLAGIGTAVAGVATGNPLLIGAGASIVAGDVRSEAAKKAAKQQMQASDEAMGETRRVFEDTRAGYAPYQNVGTSAAGSLGSLLGLPPVSSAPVTGAVPQPAALGPLRPAGALPGGPGASSAMLNQGSSAGTLGGAAGVQVLQAPDGSVKTVPAAQAQWYIQRGARAVETGGGAPPPLV
jgi:hypothetical protein